MFEDRYLIFLTQLQVTNWLHHLFMVIFMYFFENLHDNFCWMLRVIISITCLLNHFIVWYFILTKKINYCSANYTRIYFIPSSFESLFISSICLKGALQFTSIFIFALPIFLSWMFKSMIYNSWFLNYWQCVLNFVMQINSNDPIVFQWK